MTNPFTYKNWSSDEDFMTEVLNILDTVETENFMRFVKDNKIPRGVIL